MAGYSGKPLAQKLGFKPPQAVWLIQAPAEYADWLGELPPGVELVAQPPQPVAAAHLFCRERADLAARLVELRPLLAPAGFLWVSWPKKASKVSTDITEDVIRELCLPLGYVDVKVCAVSEVWSGLKLVIRKSERP